MVSPKDCDTANHTTRKQRFESSAVISGCSSVWKSARFGSVRPQVQVLLPRLVMASSNSSGSALPGASTQTWM